MFPPFLFEKITGKRQEAQQTEDTQEPTETQE